MHRVLERARAEEGFTLIELMVVIMILAILIVMGLPTFLGVKARFQDRAAETDLRNTVVAARIMFTDAANYSSANESPTGVVTILSNLCFVAGGTQSAASGTPPCVSGAGVGSISVASSATQFSAARMSGSNSCFLILDATTGTRYGSTTTAANCTATYAGTAGNLTSTTPGGGGW